MPLEPSKHNPFRITKQRIVYENPWTSLLEDHLQGPNGEAGLYGYFQRVDCVMVAPVFPNNDVLLVRQWRHAFGCSSWEFPCGRLEPQEGPLEAGQRELAEEAGLQAADWQSMGNRHHSDARVAGTIYCYQVRKLGAVSATPDASEVDLHCERVPLAEALAACSDGRIQQVVTVLMLHQLQASLIQAR